MSLETAVIVTHRLLDIIQRCHDEGCVHRDIKPDNIIIEAGEPERACLLDFGLNYHDLPEIDFRTEDWQEVGNRFLRLPELSAGSRLKQDPRSDLSFVGGILFYLLIGEHPDVLLDANGRLPHQRPHALAKLQALAGTRFPRLASLFDNSFAPLIAHRYSNAGVMREGLVRTMMEQKEVRSADDDLASIMDLLATSVERHRIETINKVRDALHNVQAVFEEVQAELGGALTLAQTGFALDGEIGRNTLLWNRVGTGETLLSTTYEIIPTGDELILRMSGEPIYRGSQTAPEYGEAFRTVVRSWVLARINSVLSNPDALPPEADLFLEVRPHSTLQTAAEDALRTGKHILAFVYDPAQSKRGRLRYGLMYFLQNRRTRDVINAAFITALVPLAQLASISNILDHTSMEESRWVVLDSNLKPLEHAVIYANAQEGERIVSDLAKRYRGG